MADQTQLRRKPSKTMQALDKMAFEYELWIQDLTSAYGYLRLPEKMAVIFAFGLIISVLLPWFSLTANESLFGLSVGGGAHFAASAIIVGISHKLIHSRRNTKSQMSPLYFSPNRAAIYSANTGLLSTFINILLLLYFRQWGVAEPSFFQIEPGFYAAITCSLGLIFCGFLHFFEQFPPSHQPHS